MKRIWPLLCLAVVLVAAISFAQETNPKVILEKVSAAYKGLDTYQAEGKAISAIDTGLVKMNLETSFSMELKKPNLYLITWNQTNSAAPAMSQSGAVWSDGTQPYLYMGVMKAYSKMPNDEMALGGATGISGGAAFTIPSLFLGAFPSQQATFARLSAPKLAADEQVDGEDCYVITAGSAISKQETFWISKKSFLIKKCSRSLEPPEGGVKSRQMTDEELEAAIKGLGQDVTEERKVALRKKMKEVQSVVQATNLKGTMTELHTNIDTPKLVKTDFAFVLPDNTALKGSLFGEFLDGKSPPAAPGFPPPASEAERAKKQTLKEPKAPRTFTSTNGKSVKAQFLSLIDRTVKLRRDDGKVIEVPLDKFSQQDQDFIREQE
jgi:hypothetical protein